MTTPSSLTKLPSLVQHRDAPPRALTTEPASALHLIHAWYAEDAHGTAPTNTLADAGLLHIAQQSHSSLTAPREFTSVAVIGNHSAGKSSFINWAFGSSVQPTGMAVTTTGFTAFRAGRKRMVLRGAAALRELPHVRAAWQHIPAAQMAMFLPHLSLQFVPLQPESASPLPMSGLELWDTPGLLDGDPGYPYDVEALLLGLAQAADTACFFFDPHGLGHCNRTLRIARQLARSRCPGACTGTQYFLTKADTLESQADLHKVLVQCSARLMSELGTPHGCELPTLWIPGRAVSWLQPESNGMHQLCALLTQVVQQRAIAAAAKLASDAWGLQAAVEVQAGRLQARQAWARLAGHCSVGWDCCGWLAGCTGLLALGIEAGLHLPACVCSLVLALAGTVWDLPWLSGPLEVGVHAIVLAWGCFVLHGLCSTLAQAWQVSPREFAWAGHAATTCTAAGQWALQLTAAWAADAALQSSSPAH